MTASELAKDARMYVSLNLCLLPSSMQVIKAAIGQVRGVAEGNVSEVDITRAK